MARERGWPRWRSDARAALTLLLSRYETQHELAARLGVHSRTLDGWADGSHVPYDRWQQRLVDLANCRDYEHEPISSHGSSFGSDP